MTQACRELTPDKGDPGDRFGELQSDFPDVGLLVTTPYAKNLGHIAFHKVFALFCFAFNIFFLLCALSANSFS